MKKTSRKLALVLCAALLVLALAGCSGEKAADAVTVAIVQPVSHTSLDQIRDTVAQTLADAGLDVNIVSDNANGDMSTLATIFANLMADGADVIVPIATNTAQSAKTVFEDAGTPIVFAAVSDPEAAGLTGDDCGNITGVSDYIPAEKIFEELIGVLQPDFQKVGFVYTSSETNSVAAVTEAKAYCDAHGIAYEEAAISAITELQSAVTSLVSKGVDCLYTGTDNTIASAMATYTDVAYAAGIPVYCGADSMVSDGGFATVGVDYRQLGKQVGEMVEAIINGADPADIPVETLDNFACYVNLQAAEKLGLALDADSLPEGFSVLVEADGTSHFGE